MASRWEDNSYILIHPSIQTITRPLPNCLAGAWKVLLSVQTVNGKGCVEWDIFTVIGHLSHSSDRGIGSQGMRNCLPYT